MKKIKSMIFWGVVGLFNLHVDTIYTTILAAFCFFIFGIIYFFEKDEE